MKNKQVSNILFEIANLLESKNIPWKPQAYRKAARSILNLKESIENIKNLENIPSVGKGISKKIREYLNTGKIKQFKELNNLPYQELLEIENLGNRRAKTLYEKLKIKTIKDLKKAIEENKIKNLKGFGIKSQNNLQLSLEFQKNKRFPIKKIIPIANKIKNEIKNLKETIRVDIAGSIRRKKPTVRDIDILVSSNNPKITIERFTNLKNIKRIISKGSTKASVLLNEGIEADIRVIPDSSYGSALQYFTGSKDFSIELRKLAIKKNLKLNEYGLFDKKTNKKIAGKNEKDIFKKLGLKFIPPEKREV